MPIRPENRARYPADWPAISKRIREERAEGRCECTGQCGIDHEEETRSRMDDFIDAQQDRCQALNGHRHPVTDSRVVLTVMHLDHTPEHCDDDNLLAACQRCHNRYDAPKRRQGIQERARAERAISDLFEAPKEDA